jgi:hypothetical protein
MDSVYLWFVHIDMECEGVARKDLFDEDNCLPFCSPFDGCKYWCGEDESNCTFCTPPVQPNPTFDLYLTEIKIKTDFKKCTSTHPRKKYQEDWIKGKYNIKFGFVLNLGEKNSNNIWENKERVSFAMFGTANNIKIGQDHKVGEFSPNKKGGLKRHNCNFPKNKNRQDQIKTYNQLLVKGYSPYNSDNNPAGERDEHRFAFYLLEQDIIRNFHSKGMATIPTQSSNSSETFSLFSDSYPYSYIKDQNINNPHYNDQLHILPYLSDWDQISPNLYRYKVNFDEAEVTFELRQ